ncbi:MAG: ATP-binding protein [Ignavibacteria bacterium]|nr:ATP-binding protein [Ignavibacteria bacterium]
MHSEPIHFISPNVRLLIDLIDQPAAIVSEALHIVAINTAFSSFFQITQQHISHSLFPLDQVFAVHEVLKEKLLEAFDQTGHCSTPVPIEHQGSSLHIILRGIADENGKRYVVVKIQAATTKVMDELTAFLANKQKMPHSGNGRSMRNELFEFLFSSLSVEYMLYKRAATRGHENAIDLTWGNANEELREKIAGVLDNLDQQASSELFTLHIINCENNTKQYPVLFTKIHYGYHYFGSLAIVTHILFPLTNSATSVCRFALNSIAIEEHTSYLQAALTRADNRIELLFDSIPMMVFLVDRDLNIFFINAQVSAELGYIPHDLIGRKFTDVVAPEHHKHARAEINRSYLHPAKQFSWELLKVTKGGHKKWVSETGKFFRLHDESPLLLILSEDISRQKSDRDYIQNLNVELEKRVIERTRELRINEEKFQNLFESSHDVFFIIENDGRISELSPAIQFYSHRTRDEIIGTNIHDNNIVELNDINAAWEQLVTFGEIIDMEFQLNGISSVPLIVSCNAKARFSDSGTLLRIEGSFRNITDRKTTEQALLKKVQTEKLLAGISAGFINLPLSKTRQAVKKSIQAIAEYTRSDVVQVILSESIDIPGKTLSWSSAPALGQNSAFQRQCVKYVTPLILQEDIINYSILHLSGNENDTSSPVISILKRYGIISALFLPLHYRNQKIGLLGFYITQSIPDWMSGDISFLTILREIYSNLIERKLIEKKITEARNQAEESQKIKEEFLTHVTHEFRTPLNAIVGSTYLLNKSLLDKKQKQWVTTLKVSADTLLTLVNEILEYSVIRGGEAIIEHIDFSLSSAVNRVIQLAKVQAEEKHIACKVIISPDVPENLSGDPDRLAQILSNLISNAIKFTDSGKVTLAISVHKILKTRTLIQFEVSDSGIGIASERLHSIFSTFSHGTGSGQSGAGLGLAITKRLVDLLEGFISVKSQPERGSIFTVTLPFETATSSFEEDRKAYSSIHPPHFRGLRVLVVEDNSFNQLIIRDILTLWKAKFSIAQNGSTACDLLIANRFDIVLLDIGLPDMSGYEIATFIRNELPSDKCQLPVIALTAGSTGLEKARALHVGINDYIVKPFSEYELAEKIQELIPNLRERNSRHTTRLLSEIGKRPPRYFRAEKLLNQKSITRDFLVHIIDSFAENAPAFMNELKEYFNTGNRTEIGKIAHKAKSMYAYLRLTKAEQLLKRIEENALNSAKDDLLRADINKLDLLTQKVIIEMTETQQLLGRDL